MKIDSLSSIARSLLAGFALVVGLAACGTTSSLTSSGQGAGNVDLTPYSRLLVTDFADEATDKAAPEDKPNVKTKVEAAGKSFPDLIASTITAGGAFMDVSRAEVSPEPDASTLVMRGALTRWDDGDATLRILVGFGAGNARLDARIQLLDGGTGAVLGTWIVDKNSWALGGLVAAAQTPETFMPGAAKSIGDELSRRKREGSIPQQKRK